MSEIDPIDTKKILENRIEYDLSTLKQADIPAIPFVLFDQWIEFAAEKGCPEPMAMNLATVSANNMPSSRMVLLRHCDDSGLVFFTNYKSRKAQEILENPHVAVTFFWPQLQRQIRVEGKASQTTDAVSDKYFAGRPRLSQLAAHASPQSEEITDREFLESRLKELESTFPETVPRPADWGGFIVEPSKFEFWQGRRGRLHDRIQYRLSDKNWLISRLAP